MKLCIREIHLYSQFAGYCTHGRPTAKKLHLHTTMYLFAFANDSSVLQRAYV